MMIITKKEIYSSVKKDLLLHIVCKLTPSEVKSDRINIVPDNNFLQCSYLVLPDKKTFVPHKHIKKERYYKDQIAQESWVVIKGQVKCILYDIDDKIIHVDVLNEGDSSFTLEGGHTYEILQDNTVVYEYKTGPYEGQKLDKVFINKK